MAVTLKMLSEQTGFSPATISRVLNNDPRGYTAHYF